MSTSHDQMQELMGKMGNEDAALDQALQTPPPQMQNQNPTLNDMGLEALKVHMSENGYNTFLTIMHWAVMSQKMSDGIPIKWDDEAYATMQAPFVGFGNAFLWESSYSSNIAKIVHAHFLNWHGNGARYRAENKLPHIMLKEVAPLMANQARGWVHMQYIRDLVNDASLYTKL